LQKINQQGYKGARGEGECSEMLAT